MQAISPFKSLNKLNSMIPSSIDPLGILPEEIRPTHKTLPSELQALRRCLRDLVVLSTLPAMWTEWEPVIIAESLAETLLSALRADFVYVRLKDLPDEVGIEVARGRDGFEREGLTSEIGQALTPHLKFDSFTPTAYIPNPIGKGMIRIAAVPIGHLGQGGTVVAGSSKPDFPTETDSLLLRVGANQVTVGLQTLRLLLERKDVEQALTEGARQQEALYQLADQLHRAKSFEDIYEAALQAIISALQCDRASILLFDDTGVMRFVGWRGLSDGYRSATEGHSPWQPDEKNPRPIGLTEVDQAALDDGLKAIIKREGIRALAFIPLISEGRLIGKFMSYFNRPHRFNDKELELSLTIARQLAFALDRKRAEAALRESEVRFRAMADTATVMIWMSGPDQQFTYLNKTWLAFTGRTLEEELGFGWAKGVHPYDAQGCLEIYIAAFEARHAFEMEYRLRRFDGSYHWVVNQGVPRFEAGQFMGYIGSCLDIHVRKQVELEERLLAEAGKVLTSSLDPTVRLTNVARLIVPDLADWCSVTLFNEDWSVDHVAVAHIDEAKVALAQDLQRRYPARQEELAKLAQPWQQGQSELYPEISEAMLEAGAQDAEHYQILRDLNLRSAMAVPLVARGRVLGLMLFVWAESGYRYDEQDLTLAEELARRAAIALDNVRLYEAEQLARRVAEKTTKRIAALQTVTAALSVALTPAEVSEVVLQKSVSVLGASGAAVMLLTEDGESLEIFRATGYSEVGLKPFQRFPLAAPIPASEAVRRGQPVWIASYQAFMDRYPQLASVRPADSRTEAVAVVPLLLEGRTLGALAISFAHEREFSAEDKDFLETLASLCSQALDRAHLYEAEQKARTEAEAAQHSLALLAEVRERHRLAQELHDNVAQTVAYLNLKIASLPQLIIASQPERIMAELNDLKQVVGEAYTDIRGEIFNLRAGPADEFDFLKTLKRYIYKYKRFYHLDIQLVFETAETHFGFPARISIPLVRTLQEALMNVRKHAQVDNALLRLSCTDYQIRISVEDRGRGFDPTQKKETSFGLNIMRERIESIGGRLEIESAPGQGTKVTLFYTLSSEAST